MLAVAVIDWAYVYSGSSSEQVSARELVKKETNMRNQFTTTNKSSVLRIGITVRFKQVVSCLVMAALLVFGYGDGLSPSAIAYSPIRG
jgi:hypothetical protein